MNQHVPANAPPNGGDGSAQVKLREYFANPANDPFDGAYATALALYAVPPIAGPAAVPAVEVRDLACNARAAGIQGAFVAFHTDGLMHVFTQLDKVCRRLGFPATPWDNLMYATMGELQHNHGVLVGIPNDYFNIVNHQIQVPTPDAINLAFAGDIAVTQLGPFHNGDAGTETIRVRRICFVPHAYVEFFLAGPQTPRALWQLVHGQIVLDNRAEDCKPLIDFLRAALTVSVVNESPVLAIPLPVAPLPDAFLARRRRTILEDQFPQLNSALPNMHQNQIIQHDATRFVLNQEKSSSTAQRRPPILKRLSVAPARYCESADSHCGTCAALGIGVRLS